MKPTLTIAILLLCLTGCGDTIHNHYDGKVKPDPIVDPLPEPPAVPSIVGVDEVEPGAPLFLSANVHDGSVIAWQVDEPLGLDFRTFDGGKEFASAAPLSGEVRVTMAVAHTTPSMMAGNVDLKLLRKTITIKGQEPRPGPQPGPQPGPKPEPDPTPVPVGPNYALVIYQSEALPKSPNLAVLMQSDFGKRVMDAGGKFRFYDADHPDAGPQYAAELKQRFIDLPGVLVYSLDGKTVIDAFALGDMDKDDVLKKLGVR